MPIHQICHRAELDDPVDLPVEEEGFVLESLDHRCPPAEDVFPLVIKIRGLSVPESPLQVLVLDLNGEFGLIAPPAVDQNLAPVPAVTRFMPHVNDSTHEEVAGMASSGWVIEQHQKIL